MALSLSTKGSIDIVTRVLAKELGPKKIRVNSINPGGTETEGAHALGVMGSEFEKHHISQTPLGRFEQPEDIAPVAVFCLLKHRHGSQARSFSLQAACAKNSNGLPSGGRKLQIRMVAGFAEMTERQETLVAVPCNHPNCLVVPFRLELIRLAA